MSEVIVTFGRKDSDQKPDCLFCPNPATGQANAADKNKIATAAIRCCNNASCKDRAAEVARSFVGGAS